MDIAGLYMGSFEEFKGFYWFSRDVEGFSRRLCLIIKLQCHVRLMERCSDTGHCWS